MRMPKRSLTNEERKVLKQLLESGKVTEYSRVILSRLRRMDLGDFQDDLKLIEQAMELAKK